MSRVYNFSAGPSMLPNMVLNRIKKELLEYEVTSQSVMEMSHRSKEYLDIFEKCDERFRSVLKIPQDYSVLFLQGGAFTQFAMVPMNLMTISKSADYVLTGSWAEKAYAEGKKFGTARVIASSKDSGYTFIPEIDISKMDETADFMHICYNNTIYGTEFQSTPKSIAPLAADVSSMILSKPLKVSDFGIIYASAQKNMGIAGLTVVVIKDDLLVRSADSLPTMLNYRVHKDNGSMFNTPSTFAIYVLSLMLEWIESEIGSLEQMAEINQRKAAILYDYLDESRLFKGVARKDSRSIMNICFSSNDEKLDKEFCKNAESNGMLNLSGHRLVGGIRASIYNAMPVEGVIALREFMNTFETEHI